MGIILASKSPRRRELLKLIAPCFDTVDTDVDEAVSPKLTPAEAIAAISLKKAKSVLLGDGDIVISADTAVIKDGKILGKPKDSDDAFNMLSSLSGKTHKVITAFTVLNKLKCVTETVETLVTFAELTECEIREYIASGEPFDKAGAYGIQGKASAFVTRIEGDYFSVVGFPVSSVNRVLKDFMEDKKCR